MSQIEDTSTESWIELVKQKVESVRFGHVQIIVHEGRVTQVESTDKTRLKNEVITPTPRHRIK